MPDSNFEVTYLKIESNSFFKIKTFKTVEQHCSVYVFDELNNPNMKVKVITKDNKSLLLENSEHNTNSSFNIYKGIILANILLTFVGFFAAFYFHRYFERRNQKPLAISSSDI